MESGGCTECSSDFGFGFNDAKFSDRTIRLEIISPYLTDLPRKRNHLQHDASHSDSDDADQSDGNPFSTYTCSTETKTIHINTLILAGKSLFFYKLFSNGMAESNQQHVTLQIQKSEEDAFMGMLKFMYTNTLSESTPSALLDLLVAADKYEVHSCTKYCLRTLLKLPKTCESALLYLDIPSTILTADTVQSLKESAKEFLVAHFKDISKFQNEMLGLPLVGIEAVLSSNYLQVSSEDEIYDFVMMWVRRHYTNPAERQQVLKQHLLRLIRFTHMSPCKLKEVLTCTDINLEHVSKLVFDALSLETPHPHLLHLKEEQRAYKLIPVKVIHLDSPYEECVVFIDLKREVCANLDPYGKICSRPFVLGRQVFQLMMMHHTGTRTFGVFLHKVEDGSMEVEFNIAARKKPSQEFMYDNYNLGVPNLFGVPWAIFIAENSCYFIDDVLYLRVELKIKK